VIVGTDIAIHYVLEGGITIVALAIFLDRTDSARVEIVVLAVASGTPSVENALWLVLELKR